MSHHNKLLLFVCAILLGTNTDFVQSKFIYRSDTQRWIGQNKMVATWEEAKQNCEKAGVILASPINEQLLKYIKSYIEVNGHTNAYFIGVGLKSEPEPQFVSIEGIQLDNMPEAVFDMIDKLDPREGKCLNMNRDSIRVVPCWSRLPYICYTGVTTNGTDSNEPIEAERVTQAVDTAPLERDEQTETKSVETPAQAAETKEVEVTTRVESVTTETNELTDAAEIELTPFVPDCNLAGYTYVSTEYTSSCYKLYLEHTSWDQAKRICEKDNGYLVIFNDENEAKTVMKMIAKPDPLGSLGFWVGIQDDTGMGHWRSIRGHRLERIYNVWHKYSTNKYMEEACALINEEVELLDYYCDYYYGFICEQEI